MIAEFLKDLCALVACGSFTLACLYWAEILAIVFRR